MNGVETQSYAKKFDEVCADARGWIKNVEFAFGQLKPGDSREAKTRFYDFLDNITQVIAKEVKGAALQCLDFAQQVDPNVKITTSTSLERGALHQKPAIPKIKRKKRKISSNSSKSDEAPKPTMAADYPDMKDECPICFITMDDSEKLKEHFSAKHENTGQKTAKCNCGKKFYDLKCYLYHFKNKHGNGPRDRCPICFKKGLRETKFVLHLRSHFFKYKCDLCPKFLQIKEHLISHRSQHMREFPEPCKCKVCGNKFYDVLEYEDHMATAHLSDEKKKEASLPCASCKKVFASTDALKEHDCEDGGDDKEFHCCVCGKYFLKDDDLSAHMEEQHDDDADTDACKICNADGDESQASPSKKRKSSVSTAEVPVANPVQCSECGRLFKNSFNLNIHFGMVHKKDSSQSSAK